MTAATLRDPVTFYACQSDTVLAYGCPHCERVWRVVNCGGDHECAWKHANTCCNPLCVKCDKAERYRTPEKWCQACGHAEADLRWQKRLAKLKHVPADQYTGFLYDDRHDGRLFDDVADLFEAYDEDDEERPTWAWATEEHRLAFSAYRMLEIALDDFPDGMDKISDAQVAGLQELLDAWCAQVDVRWYSASNVIVDLPERLPDEEEPASKPRPAIET